MSFLAELKIFGVRLSGDEFIQSAHEPGQVHQPFAAAGDGLGIDQQPGALVVFASN